MGLFLEVALLAQDVLPSQIIFGSFKHFQCALHSFSLIIPSVVPSFLPDIPRHSATQWVRSEGRTENPRTGTRAQFGLSLAKFHFQQLIVFLWCVGFNCLSLNIRLNWWVLVWRESFALSELKLNIINSLFSIENHAVSVVQKMWFFDCLVLPRLVLDLCHDPTIASRAVWPQSLFCNLILVGIPAELPCSGQQNVAACLLTCLSCCDQITPSQHFLHWLPVKFREAWSQPTWVLQPLTETE